MDKDALLAAMYDPETPSKPVERISQRMRTIKVGAISYEVPTVEYMHYLEQLVLQQGNILTKQQRIIDRLNTTMFGTRAFIRRQTSTLADLRNQQKKQQW